MVKEKGLKEYLQDDETLKRKATYEKFSSVKYGFDDSEAKEAYKRYREIIDKN